MPGSLVPAELRARPEYADAFRAIASRIADSLDGLPKKVPPIRMYVAGGAALHFHKEAARLNPTG